MTDIAFTDIPGRNHSYTLDVPFFTLRAADERFLSNPKAIMKDAWHQWENVNVATNPYWACAWVVYTVKELRTLYSLLSPARQRFAHPEQFPITPYSGIMTKDEEFGMIVCEYLRELSKDDIKKIERQMSSQPAPAHVKHVSDWSQAPQRLRRVKTEVSLDELSKQFRM